MSKVKDGNYISIQAFMVKDLNLKGNELLIYGIIYGFSQAENQTFSGGLQYLADWTNSTKQGVLKNLKSLQEKGYIEKNENYINGVKFVEYYATKFNGVLNKVEQGVLNKVEQGVKQSLTNNIDNITLDNTNNNKRFKPPTLEEVKAYCIERQNNVDPQRFIDYYTANGWQVGRNKMKDWKAAVRTWERNNFNSAPVKKGANGVVLDDRQTDDLDGIL